MEWNWLSGNNMTSFLLAESTGDSEEVKSDFNHEEVRAEGVMFRFNDDENEVVVDDDDAQSCSYGHSSYINTRYENSPHDLSLRLISNDDDDDDIGDGDIDDGDDDDDKNKNQRQMKVMDSSKQQWRSHGSCVHDPSSNQREIDRKFWETCLAS